MTLFESSERMRAITQGEWNLPDDSIMICCFITLFRKYIVSQVVKRKELFIRTANEYDHVEQLFVHILSLIVT